MRTKAPFPECRQLRSALGAPQATLATRIIPPNCSADVSVPVKACPATCRATWVELNGGRHSNCPDLDRAHLLPPRPLDPAVEFCCRHRCFPRGDVRSLTECPYLRPPVRARRQLELRMFGKNAFTTVR